MKRVMATATRVGDKEGNGDGGKSNGDCWNSARWVRTYKPTTTSLHYAECPDKQDMLTTLLRALERNSYST